MELKRAMSFIFLVFLIPSLAIGQDIVMNKIELQAEIDILKQENAEIQNEINDIDNKIFHTVYSPSGPDTIENNLLVERQSDLQIQYKNNQQSIQNAEDALSNNDLLVAQDYAEKTRERMELQVEINKLKSTVIDYADNEEEQTKLFERIQEAETELNQENIQNINFEAVNTLVYPAQESTGGAIQHYDTVINEYNNLLHDIQQLEQATEYEPDYDDNGAYTQAKTELEQKKKEAENLQTQLMNEYDGIRSEIQEYEQGVEYASQNNDEKTAEEYKKEINELKIKEEQLRNELGLQDPVKLNQYNTLLQEIDQLEQATAYEPDEGDGGAYTEAKKELELKKQEAEKLREELGIEDDEKQEDTKTTSDEVKDDEGDKSTQENREPGTLKKVAIAATNTVHSIYHGPGGRGTGLFADLLTDDDEVDAKKEEWDRTFSEILGVGLGTDYWTDYMCRQKIENKGGSTAFVIQGDILDTVAHIEGERTDLSSYNKTTNETNGHFFYKISFVVNNPAGVRDQDNPGDDNDLVFNVVMIGPAGERNLFAESIVLEDEAVFARTGEDMIFAESANQYDEVCIVFNRDIRYVQGGEYQGTNRICNSLV